MAPSASLTGVARTRTTTAVRVDLLQRDVGLVPRGHPHLARRACAAAHSASRPPCSRATHVDAGRSAQRDDRRAQRGVVGHEDRAVAARERRVDQALARDGSLDGRTERPALQADTLADPERARDLEHDPGDHVAERALRREPDHDRRDGASERDRARVQVDDAQRDDDDHQHRHELDQEADGRRGAGVEAAHQARPDARARGRARSAIRPWPGAAPWRS